MPINVAVTLLPIDQLSSGVCIVIASPYRSPMRRPLHVTTKAAVIPESGSKAPPMACLSVAALDFLWRGALGGFPPQGPPPKGDRSRNVQKPPPPGLLPDLRTPAASSV